MNRTFNDRPYTSDVLASLSDAKPVLIRLRLTGKRYVPLIDEILLNDCYGAKELRQKLNISHAKLRKWLDMLYKDMLELFSEDTYTIDMPKVRVTFCLQGDMGSMSVPCSLPILPRIGERVDLPFIRPSIGTGSLYVFKVDHHYTDDGVRIVIFANTLPPYIASLKEIALLEGKLDYRKEKEMSPSELTSCLLDLYKTPPYYPEYGYKKLTKRNGQRG